MNSSEKMYIRKLFKTEVALANGQAFEDLFRQIMTYSNPHFRPVNPQGAKGDRKNDGFDDVNGVYYQVYAPENLEVKIQASIKKLKEDFEGLFTNWENINEFFYVLNDKYKGNYPDIEFALKELELKYKIKCRPFLTKDLEEKFVQLDVDQIKTIIGDFKDPFPLIYESKYKYIQYHENKNFIGRSEYIEGLSSFFQSKTGITKIVIKGRGGLGKTQTTMAYTFKHMHDYDLILWLNAENIETLAFDFTEIYSRMGFPQEDLKVDAKIDQIKLLLESNVNSMKKWLIIFDNASNEDSIINYLPLLGRGDILITSQNDNWFSTDLEIELSELPRGDSIQLLKRYSGSHEDDNLIDELAVELDCFPLALVQAGSYIKVAKTSIKNYLADFKTEKRRHFLLKSVDPMGKKEISKEYGFVLSTVWQKSFDVIQAQSSLAAEILQSLSFVSTAIFPLEHLRLVIEKWTGEDNVGASDLVLALLTSYSLIQIYDSGVTVHRLVQLVTWDSMNKELRHGLLENLSHNLLNSCPYAKNETGSWNIARLLTPHYLHIVEHQKRENTLLYERINFQYLCGKFFARENAMYSNAIQLLEEVNLYILMLLKEQRSSNYIEFLLLVINDLAFAYEQKGEFLEAQQYYLKNIQIGEEVYGVNSREMINKYNNLATCYSNMGKYSEAFESFQKCLKLHQSFGTEEKGLITLYSNLGSTLTLLGSFEEAKKMLTRAITVGEQEYKKGNYRLYMVYNNYAELIEKFGQYDDAIFYYNLSLVASSERFIDKNPYEETVINNIGLILLRKRRSKRGTNYV
ncbi:tetratricopeptide repeat protein [Paenibacillus gorillae]|uniref:tetratricopeptide repeat protein n=1 Tax=Paenibacillus gorillae TaxID=1243662 RepID=UPI0004B871C3|nr:tetratricopeptide repeat protein [Paenibacillus gorillae]